MRKKVRGRIVRAARRLSLGALAALATLAMLAPALAPLIGDELAAYRPDHGHLVAGSVVPPHEHPYGDHDAAQGRPEGSATLTYFGAMDLGVAARLRAAQAAHDLAADLGSPRAAATEGAEIVFTHGGDGSPGSTSAPALPGVVAVAAAIEGWALQAVPGEAGRHSSPVPLVPVPPPRV